MPGEPRCIRDQLPDPAHRALDRIAVSRGLVRADKHRRRQQRSRQRRRTRRTRVVRRIGRPAHERLGVVRGVVIRAWRTVDGESLQREIQQRRGIVQPPRLGRGLVQCQQSVDETGVVLQHSQRFPGLPVTRTSAQPAPDHVNVQNRRCGPLGCLDDAAVKMLAGHRQHARTFVRSEPVFRDQAIVMASLVRDRLMGVCHDTLVGTDRLEHA